MARIRFQGFLAGAQTTLQVKQGSLTKGPLSISAWQQPAQTGLWSGDSLSETLSVSVDEIRPGGWDYAPLGVEFRIAVTGAPIGDTPDVTDEAQFVLFDPTVSQIQYVIHTGDSGNYRNERVGHTAHRNKAFQYGQNPGHVYSEPGTYTGRSIYVYDENGNWGMVALPDLTVIDPLIIQQQQRIVIAPDGDFSDAPPHNLANRCVTPQDLLALWSDNSSSGIKARGSVHITAKPGTTWVGHESISLQMIFMTGRCVFDTWDNSDTFFYDERNAPLTSDAKRPLFEVVGGEGSGWPIAVKNWRLNFGFDRTQGAPDTGWAPYVRQRSLWSGDDRRFNTNNGSGLIGMRTVWDNVDVEGAAGAVFSCGSQQWVHRDSAVFLNDCLFQGNNEYVYYQPSNLFTLGCQLLESIQNDLGSMGRNRIGGAQRGYLGHKGLRESVAWVVYQNACFWECRGGWSGQNDGDTGFGNQNLFRFQENSGNYARAGKRFHFCNSVYMGPIRLDWISEDDNGMHFILENNLIVHNPFSYGDYMIGHHGGRKTIRNCMFVVLDTPMLDDGMAVLSGYDLTRFEDPGNTMKAGRLARPIEYAYLDECLGDPAETLHNTVVVLRSEADLASTFEWRNTTYNATDITGVPPTGIWPVTVDVDTLYPITEGHNVYYAPNLSTPRGPAMDTVALPRTGPDGVRVLDMAVRFMWERVQHTLTRDVGPGQTTALIPYPLGFDSVATGQADYAGSNNNHGLRIRATNTDFGQLPFSATTGPDYMDAITVNFQAGGFTITNRSTQTWALSEIVEIILDRGATAMAPEILHAVDNTSLALYRPQTPQPLDNGIKSTLFDFGRELRPNAGFAISPGTGTNAAGALLPAI